MDQYKLQFQKVDPDKTAVCFTFDDNFLRHGDYIAPAFFKRGFRCTFYINPGIEGFADRHLQQYAALLKQGFEIGSHGYVHDNLSELEPAGALKNLSDAACSIEASFHVYPATFAFPYHDYTDETLALARSFHLETRNTLAQSEWFAIKTAIPLCDMQTAVQACIAAKRPLVFSGHSVILTSDEADDERLKSETGYNPILLDDLNALLDFIKTQKKYVQVLTFEQAALLAFIRQNCEISGDSFIINQTHMNHFKTFHIDIKRLQEMM